MYEKPYFVSLNSKESTLRLISYMPPVLEIPSFAIVFSNFEELDINELAEIFYPRLYSIFVKYKSLRLGAETFWKGL